MFYLVRFFICTLLVFLFTIPGSLYAGEKLSPGIRAVIDSSRYQHSHWGILVADLKSGETIYEHNANKLFSPASTTKLFTMATALDTFGADYRFKTPVYRRGSVDATGTLKGDLILVASGDLTFGGRTGADGRIPVTAVDHLAAGRDGAMSAVLTEQDPLAGINSLARQVAASGIKGVTGEVLVDDRFFETSQTWYGLVRTPIPVNEDVFDFVITPTKPGRAASVKWRPRTSAYRIDAKVKTVAATESPQISITSGGLDRIIVAGRMPANHKPSIRIWHVDKDRASFARTLFIEALQRAGVKIKTPPLGKNPSGLLPNVDAYKTMSRVALFTSPPYSETVKLILKVSHNLGADSTPLLVAAKHGKRTFDDGMAIERVFLEKAGLDVKVISLSDGAGGDPADLVTPKSTVQLLRYVATRPYSKAFYDALPILGVDGTLAHTVPHDSPARGKMHAKTGTFPIVDLLTQRITLRVKGMAGYLTASSGRKLVVLFVNNVPLMEDSDDFAQMLQVGDDLGELSKIIYLAE